MTVTAGPTQNYDQMDGDEWRPHRWASRALRFAVAVVPAAGAIGFGLLMHARWPPDRLGWNPWIWVVVVLAGSWVLLWLLSAVGTRLLPLTVLLRLSLVFPDEAPSRFRTALRAGNTRAIERRIAWIRSGGGGMARGDAAAAYMLELVAALSAHDRLTRGHGERVRAYADLIIDELGLSPLEAAKARWAALLHDVGKLTVPAEILNKRGRPTPAEWQILARHPDEGMRLIAPVLDWLGEWAAGIGQHHERWDGRGYPRKLAGEDIHISARIIAVADTFDVITSHRSYKKPISAAAARTEITRCAGTQFDPTVVRAFLKVGLGRLRGVGGPLTLLAGLPPLRQIPVGELVHGVTTAAVATTAAVVSTAGVVGVPVDETPAAARPTVVAAPRPPAKPARPQQTQARARRPAKPAAQPRRSPAQAPAPAAPAPQAPAPEPAAPVAPTPTREATGDCAAIRAGSGDFAGRDLRGCDLSGLRFSNGTLRGADLRDADLSGATIDSADLGGARLSGANLRGAHLSNGNAAGIVLADADLRSAVIERISLADADLSGANLSKASFTEVEFGKADLSRAILTGASFVKCDLSQARTAGTSFSGVRLDQTTLPS